MSLFNSSMSPADIAACTGANNGFGGDGWWIILLLLCFGNGWGNGFGGAGNQQLSYDFPWLLNGQNSINNNTNNGFRDQEINNGINGIQSSINALSSNLLSTNYQGQISDLQAQFANQTAMNQGFNNLQAQLAQCCCDNRLATANLGSDIAREACAGRTLDTQNTQAILNAINGGIQSIKDQMCNDKIDAKNEKINELQNELNISKQNLLITNGFANEVDQLYNRLNNCPVPSTPVYGRTPIFNNIGCNCGCMGN